MSKPFTPRKPDYNVSAMDKRDDTRNNGNIGAAWLNADGTINIKLNPFVVIDTRMHDLAITLFPKDKEQGQ